MARARNIKPGLYKNEDLAECSIWARYLFPGLWTLADREGRLEDRPKRIKAELLAFDTQDVEPLLRELAARSFIVRYQIEGASYIQIAKFSSHQTPHYSEKPSVIKPPPLQEKGQQLEQPDSENQPIIKRGAQPPDSLNPDSPIADSGKKQARFAPPDWVPPEPWAGWLEMRTRKKTPNTDRALKVAIAKLDELRRAGQNLTLVIDEATTRGWTSFWPYKGGGTRAAAESGNAAVVQEAIRKAKEADRAAH